MNTQPKESLQAYSFNPTILREYDIRGIVEKTLTEIDAYNIGLGFGTILRRKGGKTVCVGYDGRHSSPDLQKALVGGLIRVGCDVINIGLGPTPMVYFTLKDRCYDAGIMVTGSHNPKDYNGFKISLQNGSFYGDDIQALGALTASGDYLNDQAEGTITELDIKESYVERLIRDLKWPEDKALKIAWDAGNGAAGEILELLIKRIPGEHVVLYSKIDGDFPNHHPDPTVDKNLVDLIKAVKDNQCDFGIAFDGDGDRIGAVDENGTILRCDHLISVYAKDILSRRPGATIIGDVKCSQSMFADIAKNGGNPIMWKTGHSLVKSKMAETKAPLAGELSGHIFFADHYYGFDDALYCAIRLINIYGRFDHPLSGHFADFPKLISTSEIRIEVPEEGKHDLPKKIEDILKPLQKEQGFTLITIDGVRVVTADGWWLLRASNTQNCLVARLESATAEGMEHLKTMLQEQLANLNIKVPEGALEI